MKSLRNGVILTALVGVTALFMHGIKDTLSLAAAQSDSLAAIGGVTPSEVVKMFDANVMVVMALVGLAWRYLPWLKAVPNMVIPWVNAVLYMLGAAFGAVPAHADTMQQVALAGFNLGAVLGIAQIAATAWGHSIGASLWWDKFLKPVAILAGVKKPSGSVPEPQEKGR